jgi:hypothetical protein
MCKSYLWWYAHESKTTKTHTGPISARQAEERISKSKTTKVSHGNLMKAKWNSRVKQEILKKEFPRPRKRMQLITNPQRWLVRFRWSKIMGKFKLNHAICPKMLKALNLKEKIAINKISRMIEERKGKQRATWKIKINKCRYNLLSLTLKLLSKILNSSNLEYRSNYKQFATLRNIVLLLNEKIQEKNGNSTKFLNRDKSRPMLGNV